MNQASEMLPLTTRKESRRRRKQIKYKLLAGFSTVLMLSTMLYLYMSSNDSVAFGVHMRALSSVDDLECDKTHKTPLVIAYLCLILYCFLALAIICDDYFEPTLSTISEKLSLSEDVAGATFMAAGSSAPELFTSLNDTLFVKNSIGVGTIVGSAMFNILIIVALTAAVGDGKIKIDYRPLLRDTIFYVGSIFLMGVAVLNQGEECVVKEGEAPFTKIWNNETYGPNTLRECGYGSVSTIEAGIMCLAYFGYIVFMVFNETILGFFPNPNESSGVDEVTTPVHLENRHSFRMEMGLSFEQPEDRYVDDGNMNVQDVLVEKSNHSTEASVHSKVSEKDVIADTFQVDKEKRHSIRSNLDLGFEQPEKVYADNDDIADVSNVFVERNEGEDDDDELFAIPSSLKGKFYFFLTFPFTFMYFISVPNTELEKYQSWGWVWLSFGMNIFWIFVFSFVMVHFGTEIGCLLEIDPVIIGVVILSVGTSVPDAIASVIVAKQGFANMAVANALGSNIFDILIGLGFSWFLSDIIYSESIVVNTDGSTINFLVLLGTVGFFIGVLLLNKFQMNWIISLSLVILYFGYVAFAILSEKCVIIVTDACDPDVQTVFP